MSVFSSELTIIRRFLRDPSGDIWSDDDIRTYWNDAQAEIAAKAGYLERVHTYKYPPQWSMSYIYDWEYQHAEGDKYQCLIPWQAGNRVVCYPWEAGYWLTNSSTPDSGYRFTHPWEGVLSGSPADVVPVPLHAKWHKMKFVAYDEDRLEPMDRKGLAETDGFYRTTAGTPYGYWRPDDEGNQVVLYPRPSSVVWDETGVLLEPTDTFDDDGGIQTWDEADIDERDSGMITVTIDTEDQLFMIFEAIPQDITVETGDWTSVDLDWPDYLLKYVRYATLERCFAADTDGHIPSLRDYWRTRKTVGIQMIKKFKNMRRQDRDYRLSGGRRPIRSRHPRLPAEYPRQWP